MNIFGKLLSEFNNSVTLNLPCRQAGLFQSLKTNTLKTKQIPIPIKSGRNDNNLLKANLKILFSLAVIIFLFSNTDNFSQKKEEVRISPKASVEQTVGFTKITIDYSRPGVKGRKIWGGLVPYDVVWRAGANEATKITFTSDVKINGKKLKAGSYGFFTIPTAKNWTLIFNKTADQWGAFEYNDVEDALRIEVTPEKENNCWQEWLVYTITKTSDNTAVVRLEWEKLKVLFTIEVEI